MAKRSEYYTLILLIVNMSSHKNVLLLLVVCGNWTFGLACAKTCGCEKANSALCDTVNGTCTCKTGWEGNTCETDIDECVTQNITCPDNAYCHNYDGGSLCKCNEEYDKEDVDNTFVCKSKNLFSFVLFTYNW